MALSLDKFIVGTLVFMIFIIGGMFYVHSIEVSYADEGIDMGLDKYINDTYVTITGNYSEVGETTTLLLNSSYDQSKNVQGRLLDQQLDVTDTESSLFSGAFSVFRLIPTSISLVNNVMNEVAIQIGIPGIFIQIAFSILVIFVIFSIIYLIFRVRS